MNIAFICLEQTESMDIGLSGFECQKAWRRVPNVATGTV